MKGLQVPPPTYGPAVWNQEQEPIAPEGTDEEKLHEHLVATVSGDARRSYGLFLGLADLQDTVIGRKARNTGHKALRARAVADLADVIGWERATGVYYMGVPDMAIGPLYYSLYDAACVTMTNEFPELVPDQLDFARSPQPSSRGRAAQLERPRSRSAAALTVRLTQPSPRGRAPRLERPRTPRAAASLGPRLARNLARHSAGSREVWGILVGDALAAVLGHDAAERLHEAVHVGVGHGQRATAEPALGQE